jgi:hypothetical protein
VELLFRGPAMIGLRRGSGGPEQCAKLGPLQTGGCALLFHSAA